MIKVILIILAIPVTAFVLFELYALREWLLLRREKRIVNNWNTLTLRYDEDKTRLIYKPDNTVIAEWDDSADDPPTA